MLGAAGAGELRDSSLVLRETTLEGSDYSLGPDITTVPLKAPVLSRGEHGSLSRCCGSELGAETGWPDSMSPTPQPWWDTEASVGPRTSSDAEISPPGLK